MNEAELIKQWEAEEAHAFAGWDFSHLDGRWDSPQPPWNYREIIQLYLNENDKLLDMGTGGGEILLTLNHPHANTYATEAWLPNFELCMKRLAPLGITIKRTYEDDKLPFEDALFDMVINRHESFDLQEVNRVLKQGGYFITQQVGAENLHEIARRLNDNFIARYPGHSMEEYAEKLTEMGYRVLSKHDVKYPVKFFDIGALVFYAKIIEWEYPNFSVKTHREKLLKCRQELEEKGFLEGTSQRFYLVAQKM
ncbi:MAG: class I SAM-dependent methyltransferase [Defluviitaleaceae bacterium]|nr:class I SAM-dependent methyltransferase [Defluviitaleaceae bacterium]MCL2275817.1 class I SAM-dependent methyltransferase [Defluviitaleaceae bacterium]